MPNMTPCIVDVTYKLIKADSPAVKSIGEVRVFDVNRKPMLIFTTQRGLLTNQMDILEKDIPLLFERVKDLVLDSVVKPEVG